MVLRLGGGVLISGSLEVGRQSRQFLLTLQSLDLGAVCPVQLDALLGLVNALQEMLLRFCRGRLYVFPAIPRRFSCLRAEDLRIPGARVGLIKADAALRVSLHAERDTKLTLIWPVGESTRASAPSPDSFRR